MDAFEDNLRTFSGSNNGPEMRDALFRCFELIRVEISTYTDKIQDASAKIRKAEEGVNDNGDASR